MIGRETLWAETFIQQRLQEAEHERLIREAYPPSNQQRGYRRNLMQRWLRWAASLRAHEVEPPKYRVGQGAVRPR